MRIVGISILMGLMGVIGSVFWFQEMQYLRPTPVPDNYHPIAVNESIALEKLGVTIDQKPVLLHFFNPDCPCSRFNIQHLHDLVSTYGKDIDIYAVVQVDGTQQDAIRAFQENYQLDIPVIPDPHESIAKACGVYATPQAVIINTDHSLYYRGNYNVSRYCTAPGTSFAELAIKSVLNGAPPPHFLEQATVAYGCQLPANEKNIFSQIF